GRQRFVCAFSRSIAISPSTIYNHGMWRSRMFWRLFISFCVLLLCSIGLLGIVLNSRMQQQQQRQITERLRTKAILVRELVRDLRPERVPFLQKRIVALGQEIHTRITLIDVAGRVLADSDEEPAKMENHSDRSEVREAADTGWGSGTRFSHTIGKTMMYVALR